MFQQALHSKAVRWIGLGWSAFIAENVILSHNREWIIQNYGDDNYHNLYNTLSTAACGSIAWGYLKHGRGKGPMLPGKSKAMLLAGSLVQIVGLIGLSQIPPKLQIPVTFGPKTGVTALQNTLPSDNNVASTVSNAQNAAKVQIRCPMDFKAKGEPTLVLYSW